MNILEPVNIGLSQLRVHKLRATLSILGILISVGSVTGIVSLGDGLQTTVLGQFEQAGGSSQIWVRSPSTWYRNSSGYWVPRDWEEYLENRDIRALQDASPYIKYVIPQISMGTTVRYQSVVTSADMTASSPEYLEAEMWEMDKGRFINDDDVANASKVVVIGAQLSEDLFGDKNPVGKEIKIDNVRYLVVGRLAKQGMELGAANARRMAIPYTTAQLRINGNQRLNSFTVIASSPEYVPEVARSLETVMKQNHVHGEDFEVNTGETAIEDFNRVVTILKVVAGGIAGNIAPCGRCRYHEYHARVRVRAVNGKSASGKRLAPPDRISCSNS